MRGDDITTDHISPGGTIPMNNDAGRWLIEHGEDPRESNVHAARRGNFAVMLRGLFTNKAVVNHLCPDAPPGHAVFAPTGEVLPVWRAALRYAADNLPVVILAGERYGMGSSRDWAAQGAQMLGARAVLARNFERIHCANLIGMSVLPLRLPEDWKPNAMRIAAGDTIELDLDLADLRPRARVPIRFRQQWSNEIVVGEAVALLDSERDVAWMQSGGIIPMLLQRALGRA